MLKVHAWLTTAVLALPAVFSVCANAAATGVTPGKETLTINVDDTAMLVAAVLPENTSGCITVPFPVSAFGPDGSMTCNK